MPEVYRNADGDVRLRVEDDFAILKDYFESDVGCHTYSTNALVDAVEKARSDVAFTFEESGNAHTIKICHHHVEIAPHYGPGDPNLRIGINKFKEVLDDWVRVVREEK